VPNAVRATRGIKSWLFSSELLPVLAALSGDGPLVSAEELSGFD
jgi:hypothetical protein